MRSLLPRCLILIAAHLGGPGLTLAAPDHPSEASARQRFVEASAAFDRGDFPKAARGFEAAYGERHLVELLFDAAVAWERAGDPRRAEELLRRYLAAQPDDAAARERLAALARTLHPAPSRVPPPPVGVQEPTSGETYRSRLDFDGRAYDLLGVGVRRVFGFQVYAIGLYVEDEPAHAQLPELAATAGGDAPDLLLARDYAARFVVGGGFGKAALMRFRRDVSADQTRDAYRDALGPSIFGPGAPPRRDAEALLALFEDMREGESLILRTTARGEIIVEAHGATHRGPCSPRLAHDLWDIWLGSTPLSPALKRTLLTRIATLK